MKNDLLETFQKTLQDLGCGQHLAIKTHRSETLPSVIFLK